MLLGQSHKGDFARCIEATLVPQARECPVDSRVAFRSAGALELHRRIEAAGAMFRQSLRAERAACDAELPTGRGCSSTYCRQPQAVARPVEHLDVEVFLVASTGTRGGPPRAAPRPPPEKEQHHGFAENVVGGETSLGTDCSFSAKATASFDMLRSARGDLC